MKLTKVALDTLLLDPDNTNQHDEEDILSMMAKLAAHEQVENLVVQKSTMIVCGGNGRLIAMRRLGWTHASVYLKDLNAVEFRALSIALNTRKSRYDDAGLLEQIKALQAEDIPLDQLGLDEADVERMIRDLTPPDEAGWQGAAAALPAGEKSAFQQMTFNLTDNQASDVKRALDAAKDAGPFLDTGNENSNGNALARIAEDYLGSC